ncbi:methionyl-tRNA formyltransferase [Marinomonas mediterranea]|jgi:methionyl-tRNA formyltransferase (EC 2.1.2.9)|uniref:Methionyl-tRNA formyltransferase n=1 Tax=Marinomonas mediterranea (strain ATCC 700492 / JCM 21426 / NBRC 103028 / MMB-1) TaxID=717774 RepID=F2JUI7_MARM1|nr:methionyl-tRNA formyltransferase [Marinomonas mediterranea]ADZ89320.1 Methionyl-tRNA formyltransferase [Marinomonas mediterranea MMB-1]WCN15587.1 methionyl-tRNA formyltransferase [Marinomonas mediterranea MMB-1]
MSQDTTTSHDKPLRIVFAGTPEFASASLQAVLDNAQENHYEVIAVYTQPDRPAGRGQKLVASPVKQLALENNIPVYQPLNFKLDEDKNALANLNADIMIVAAYGIILPKVVLDTPRLGCVNVHASLLPRWRGAAPIHRSLLAGDAKTGITIMQMDVGLDTGDMLLKVECDILEEDTSGTLHDRLAPLGGEALISALEEIKLGTITPEKQDEALTCYAGKLTKTEGEVNWETSAESIARQVRGLHPWPVAYTQTESGVMKIHSATTVNSESIEGINADQVIAAGQSNSGTIIASGKEGVFVQTSNGILALETVQFPSGKRMSVQDALNGKHKASLSVGRSMLKADS